MINYIKIARPDHWIKNLFILPGLVVAFFLVEEDSRQLSLFRAVTGFWATCLISSANYVINEWLDAEFDRYHPTKKNRPVVTGGMKSPYITAEYLLIAASGLLFAATISFGFVLLQLWLLAMGILYNVKPFRTKDIIYLDVLSESVNNVIRLLLGWFIVTDEFLPPASLQLGYWMSGAFLMGTKRLAEYKMINDPSLAGKYRKSFRYYSEKTLFGSSFFYALCATFFIGVFLVKYRIEYLIAIPALFLLFSYYIMLAFKADSAVQKPEKLYREKFLLLLVFAFVFLLAVSSFIDIPALKFLTSPHLIDVSMAERGMAL